MKRGDIIVGLDVGTTKICVVVAEVVAGEIEILGITMSASTGLRKGMIIDIESTVDSIRNAIKKAENLTGVNIKNVRVGISGNHIKGFESYGAIGVRGKEVSYIDIERAIESAKAVYVPLDREIIHIIPTGYILDGQNGIKDPLGMIGVRLESKVFIITASVTSLQNLIKCCERAGLHPAEIIFEPLASAEAILTEDEKELGVVIVDIGGGTTDIILYKEGWLRHSSIIAVGGNHFTNDIAVGLRISLAEAERLKRNFGSALTLMVDESEEIEIIQSGEAKKILRRHLAEIIQPRADELLDLIKSELIACGGYDIASTGIVLTGGGSMLKGLDMLSEAVLGLPVRIGYPKAFKEGEGNNPMYATGIGLVLYGFEREINRGVTPVSITGVYNKMKDWVKGIFK